MDKDNHKQEIFSERVRAGKRTYFFDVKATRSNDYYLTITESKRRYKEDGFMYEKHKIFLYKEDFDKFQTALGNTITHVKDELLPDVDFTQFDRNLHKTKTEDSSPAHDKEDSIESGQAKEVTNEVEAVEVTPGTEGENKEEEETKATQETESGIDSELKWD